MNWEPKQGEMITVWDTENKKYKREFIAITEDNKYVCYLTSKNDAYIWNYAEPIDEFKKLKKCYELGARFEYRYLGKIEWHNCISNGKFVQPKWYTNSEYRIKNGIEPEKFLKHHKEIIAWWNGAEIEYYDSCIKEWKDVRNPFWTMLNQYRVKEEPKTVAKYRYILNGKWCETRSFYETAEEAERAENAECIEIPNTRIEV